MLRKNDPHSREYWSKLESKQIKAELDVIDQLLDNPFEPKRKSGEIYQENLTRYNNRAKALKKRQQELAHTQEAITYKDRLAAITAELSELDNTEDYIEEYGATIVSQQFIRLKDIRSERKKYLTLLKTQLTHFKNEVAKETAEENSRPSAGKKFLAIFSTVFDVCKKIIDSVDDIWFGLQRAVKNPIITAIAPFLVGIISILIQPYEAIVSLTKAVGAFWNTKIDKQRRLVKMSTNLIGAALAIGGSALAVLILLQGAGIPIASFVSTVFPNVLPMILLGVYTLRLIDAVDNYRLRKKNFNKAAHEFAICNSVTDLFQKNPLEFTEQDHLTISAYAELAAQYGLQPDDLETHAILLERTSLAYNHHEQKQKDAKRKIILNSIEIIAMAIVVAGTIMGAAAIIGGTGVATFGVAPTVLLAVGVAIGLGVKLYEANEKYHLVDKGINLSKRICNNLFGTTFITTKPELVKTSKPAPAAPKLSMWARMQKRFGGTVDVICVGAPQVARAMTATQPIATPSFSTGCAPNSTSPTLFRRQNTQQDRVQTQATTRRLVS